MKLSNYTLLNVYIFEFIMSRNHLLLCVLHTDFREHLLCLIPANIALDFSEESLVLPPAMPVGGTEVAGGSVTKRGHCGALLPGNHM